MQLKNTNQVISESQDAITKIDQTRAIFDDHFARHFPRVFAEALAQAGASRFDIPETESVLKHYLSKITEGLDMARYQFAEMITELAAARRKAAAGGGTETFKV